MSFIQRKALRTTPGKGTSSTGNIEGGGIQSQQAKQKSSVVGASTDSQKNNQLNDDGSSDTDDIEEYGDMHRLVLQGVMGAGFLDAKGVKKLFQESCKYLKCQVPPAEHQSPPFIQKVVREINERIKIYDFMIRSATCEITGEKYYVFLVTIEKPVMKMQTYFTKLELNLFQKILAAILRKHNNFTISVVDCINMDIEQDSRVFNKVHAEDFVNKMIDLNYLTKVFKSEKEYDLTLGFRTIREFEPIFRDTYGDIFATCCLCKMILLNGLQCPKCTTVIHRACLKKYIKSCKTCTSCKCHWKNEDSLLVRTKERATSSYDGTGDSSQHKSSRMDNNLDDIDMPVLEPVVSPRTARAGLSSKQNKKCSKDKNSSSHTCKEKEGHKCKEKEGHKCKEKEGHKCKEKEGHKCKENEGHKCKQKEGHKCKEKEGHICKSKRFNSVTK